MLSGPPLSALWELWLRTLAQMNVDTLAMAIAVSNKLYFISDSASYQNRSLYLPPASMKLWQANLLASSRVNSQILSNSFFFWLRLVFVAACWLSLVVASRSYSSLRCAGFSSQWLLFLWSTGSRRGLQ